VDVSKRTLKNLSDVQIRAWVSKRKPVAKSDGGGLTFTLSANGTAAWILRYSHGGRRKELTLGRYPDLTLTKARERASEARLRVSAGTDVALERQREKARTKAAWTIGDLWRDYEKRAMPSLAPTTQRQQRSYYRTGLAALSTYVARDVTAEDVLSLLDSIDAERGYTAAWQARKVGMAVLEHGRARRVVGSNPFAAVRMTAIRKAAPPVRPRVMLDAEALRTFLRGLRAVDETDAAIFRLLLLTGVRVGELISAEWRDLDLDKGVWRIPKAKIKTRRHMPEDVASFDIDLPADAVALFKRLAVLAGKSRWVLPSRTRHVSTDARPMDHERILDRLKGYVGTLKGVQQIVLHDLRSTMRSHLSGLGVRTEVAERALNHTQPGMAGIYDRNDFRDERAAALNQWAAYLATLEKNDAKVVSLRRSA
jgi:integrase